MAKHLRALFPIATGFLLFAMWVLLPRQESLAAACTWNNSTGDWSDASRWSCGTVPGAGDSAVINGGVVNLTGPVTVDSLAMDAGTLQTTTELTITQQLAWGGGRIGGSGTVLIPVGAFLDIYGSSQKTRADSVTMILEGNGSWSGSGNLSSLTSTTVFIHRGELDVSAEAVFSLGSFQISPTGVLTHSGLGTTTFSAVFDNQGRVAIPSGMVRLQGNGGNDQGEYNLGSGAILELSTGTRTWLSGASVYGPGTLRLISGSLLVEKDALASNLEISNGTLGGEGVLTVTQSLAWTGGTIGGAGTLVIAPAATFEMSGSNPKRRSDARTLVNYGAASWSGTGSLTSQTAGTALVNYGTLDITSIGSFSTGSLVNQAGGTLRRAGNPGEATTFTAQFDNFGQVEIFTGTLRLVSSPGNDGGDYWIAPSGKLELTGSNRTLASGVDIRGGGPVVLSTGSITAQGNHLLDRLDLLGGSLTCSGFVTVTERLGWAAGTITGKGSLMIAPGARLDITGSELKARGETITLINRGSATWSGSGNLTNSGGGSAFLNYGSFEASANASFLSGEFTNAISATLVISGSGVTTFGAEFNNQGVITVTQGTLRLPGTGSVGGEDSGSYWVGRLASLDFAGGTRLLSASSSILAQGEVKFTGNQTKSVEGSYQVATTTIGGGGADFTKAIAPRFGAVVQTSGTLNLLDAVIEGDFIRSGGIFGAGSGTITFTAPISQELNLGLPTTFNHLVIYTGTLLVESQPADNVRVNGGFTNYGVVRKTQAVSGPASLDFGLTGVVVNVTSAGSLTAIQVERIDRSHPQANALTDSGVYWLIEPVGAGYVVDLSLPHRVRVPESALVCRHTGPGWDCGRTTATSLAVTRAGLTELSEWAVGALFRTYTPLLRR